MKIFRNLFNQSTININTLLNDANKTAINKVKLTAEKAKSAAKETIKSNKNNRAKTKSFTELIRTNKIASFLLILAATNLVYSFVPLHKTRPDILARNRLEQPK